MTLQWQQCKLVFKDQTENNTDNQHDLFNDLDMTYIQRDLDHDQQLTWSVSFAIASHTLPLQ